MALDETIEQVKIKGEIARDLQALRRYGFIYEVTIEEKQLIICLNEYDRIRKYDIIRKEEG